MRCLGGIGWLLMILVGLYNLRFDVVFLLDVACLGFTCVIVCLWCCLVCCFMLLFWVCLWLGGLVIAGCWFVIAMG